MGLLGVLLAPIKFVLLLPVRILLAFRFSAIFTLAGFLTGILGGLVAGYFAFIYSEPDDYKEVLITNLAEEGKELTAEEKKRFYRLLPPWVHTPDVEKISWMNKMLAIMWPYIDKAVTAEVIAQATPIIEQNKPSFIESIEFDSFTLGGLPPAMVGIKSFQTLEDEVIIQPQLRWIARPNVKVLVKLFGISLSAHLTHLYLEAPARITLKPLSNYFPCFSKIVVSLMSPPEVDLGLSVLGLDPLVIPAVDRLVQAQVGNAIEDMLIWPRAMTVYEEDPLPIIGKLYIRDIRAQDLRNVAGLVAKIDPFVRIGFGRKIGNFETKAEKDTSHPEWMLEGVVNVHDKEKEVLLVQVFHQKKPKNILIGVAQVPVSQLQDDVSKKIVDLPLKSQLDPALTEQSASDIKKAPTKSRAVDAGTISFELTYVPRKGRAGEGAEAEEDDEVVIPKDIPVGGGLLWVKLRSGKELESKKPGYIYPTVHLKFRGVEQKSMKYKESEIEIFDDAPFTWECKEKPEKETLHISVTAEAKGASLSTVTNPMALKRLLHSQDTVGKVDIPLRDAVSNGRTLDDYSLVGSKGSTLKVEIRWAEQLPEAPPAPPAAADAGQVPPKA